MHIVITHTAFKIYWPARLKCLRQFLEQHGSRLTVLEIAGRGSAYEFAGDTLAGSEGSWWQCLFPETRLEDLSARRISGALYQRLDELKPDVVMAGAIAFPPGVTAVRWARARDKRVIIMDNVRPEDVPRPWIVNFIKRRIYRQVDAMLVPAPSHQRCFRFWGVANDKMYFGLNVIDEEYYSSRAEDCRQQSRQLRRELDLPESFFLGVGRQVAKKNWDGLLHAYAVYRKQLSDPWGLVLVGDGPERERLENLCSKYQLEQVKFVPFVDSERLCAYYALARALILPSRYGETWGNVVNEAMACSLPVLVSRECGCAATLVKENRNGWTFSALDQEELVKRLMQFSSMPETMEKRMGTASFEIIKRWGLQRFAEGAWQAIQGTYGQPEHVTSAIDKFLLYAWRGRYRAS